MEVEQSQQSSQPLLNQQHNDHAHLKYLWCCFLQYMGLTWAGLGNGSIYAVYYNSYLEFSEEQASFLTNLTYSVQYSAALVAGIVSASRFGKYQTIVYAVTIFAIGLGSVTSSVTLHAYDIISVYTARLASIIGLFVAQSGNGAAQAMMYSFSGDQFDVEQTAIRSKYNAWIYLSGQFSVIAGILYPVFLQQFGPMICFATSCIAVLLPLPLFIFYARRLRRKLPSENVFRTFFSIVMSGLMDPRANEDQHWLDKASKKHNSKDVQDVKALLTASTTFLLMPIWFAAQFSQNSLWVFDAEELNNKVGTARIPPAEVTAGNNIILIGLIPFAQHVVYPMFENLNRPLLPLVRITIGWVFVSLALAVAGLLQLAVRTTGTNEISLFWMIPQLFLISCAEVLISVTAYDFAYSQAPASMKEVLTGMWVFMSAIGNILIAVVSLADSPRMYFYFGYSVLLMAIAIVFSRWSRSYKYVSHHDIVHDTPFY